MGAAFRGQIRLRMCIPKCVASLDRSLAARCCSPMCVYLRLLCEKIEQLSHLGFDLPVGDIYQSLVVLLSVQDTELVPNVLEIIDIATSVPLLSSPIDRKQSNQD